MNKEMFLKKIATDAAFAEKVIKLSTLEEVKAFVKDQGIGIAEDNIPLFFNSLKQLSASIDKGELSDDELDMVSGGQEEDCDGYGWMEYCHRCKQFDMGGYFN